MAEHQDKRGAFKLDLKTVMESFLLLLYCVFRFLFQLWGSVSDIQRLECRLFNIWIGMQTKAVSVQVGHVELAIRSCSIEICSPNYTSNLQLSQCNFFHKCSQKNNLTLGNFFFPLASSPRYTTILFQSALKCVVKSYGMRLDL